jgi:DNA adenine methylase
MSKAPTKSFIRYIGGKHRLAPAIAKRLHATGKTCLVDVFGGSAAVTMLSGFKKRVYNDKNGDLVNLFRVMADRPRRRELLRMLRWTLPSREVYEDDHKVFSQGGLSFRLIEDSVDRARATFYKLRFCFGGKMRSGGFAVTVCDRPTIKEVARYQKVLRDFAAIGEFFRNTVIENLDFRDVLKRYGNKKGVVLFVDPPYPGYTYYSHELKDNDYFILAEMLMAISAPVVCTYYDNPLIRKLYPEGEWTYERISGFKNGRTGKSRSVTECIISRPEIDPKDLETKGIKETHMEMF